MLGVAVREKRGAQQIALRRACRQSCRRTDALHVEDDRRRLGVIGEPGELRHQRDAGTCRRRHRARARPARANHHAERRNLVFGLDDRERRLARLLVDAVFPHVADERFAQRRGRRNRIPRDDRDAGHHAADRRRRVAFDENLAGRFVHPLDVKRILLGEVRFRVVPAGLQRALVQRDGFRLLAELLAERLLHHGHVDAEQLRQHAVVNHVAHEAAKLGVGADGGDELVERNRIEREIRAQRVQLERLVVDDRGARVERQHVLFGRFRIHGHEEIDFLLSPDVAALARADGVPGRQPRDVRREHVLARNRYAHQQDGAKEDEIGGLAARSVDGRDLNAEIVDDLGARRGGLLL